MRNLIIIVLLFIGTIQCSTETTVDLEYIEAIEREVRTQSTIDTASIDNLLDAYRSFVNSNPDDSASPYIILKEADLLQGAVGEDQKALDLYEEFLNKYPNHEAAPRAMFMKAYVYDENLKTKPLAIESYRELIDRFPNDPLSQDAQNLLNLLTDSLSTEEQVAKWLLINDSDSTNKIKSSK